MRGLRTALRVGVAGIIALAGTVLAGTVLAGTALAGTVLVAGTAGAQEAGCSNVVVAPSIDLVTRGVSTIGPIQIDLPAGRYRLAMSSVDAGHEPDHQSDQLSERWSFTLDNGYSSPITPDLATESKSATFDMGAVDLVAATSITFVHHGVAPSADSVRPSITFQCEPPTTATTTTTSTTTSTTTTTSTSTTTEPTPTVAEVTTTAPPETETTAVTTEVTTTTTPGSVKANDTLPRTGSNESILWMGLLLLTVGGVFIVVSKIVSIEHDRTSA